MANTDQYKVKLVNSDNRSEAVYFDATPDVVETSNVNYQWIDPIHAPGQIAAYQNSNSRTFNISNVRMISRTVEEADLNLTRLWILRSWTKPVFGQSTVGAEERNRRERTTEINNRLREISGQADTDAYQGSLEAERERLRRQGLGTELRGKPPAVLYLSAYSRPGSTGNTTEHINRVPVVIEQLSLPYPSDTDYINASNGTPMPTLMSLDLTMRETHSPAEYSKFNLFSYKRGTLRNF